MNQFKRETGGLTKDELDLLLGDGVGIDKGVEFVIYKSYNEKEETGTFEEDNPLEDSLEEVLYLWDNKKNKKQSYLIIGDFKMTIQERYGGEGCGSDYWYIVRAENTNSGEVFFYNFSGWYASYQGHEIEDVNEVFANLEVKTNWSGKPQDEKEKEILIKAQKEIDELK